MAVVYSNFTIAQNPLIGPFFETSFFSVRSKIFDTYADNYNLIYQDDLKTGFTKFSPKSAFSWGIESSIYGMNISAKFSTYKSESNAVFKNGNSRVFELKQKTWSVPIGFGYLTEDGGVAFNFGGTIALGMQTTQLSSVYVYSDGTRSTGFDKDLNGIYSSTGAIFVPEFVFGVGKFVYVYTSVAYQFSFS